LQLNLALLSLHNDLARHPGLFGYFSLSHVGIKASLAKSLAKLNGYSMRRSIF